MKKIVLQTLVFALTIVISGPIRAQIKGRGEITKSKIQLEEFDAVEAGGAQELVLLNGDTYTAVIETNENLQQYISYEIKNKKLRFKYNKIKNYDKMKFYITAPVFHEISISGASELKTPDGIKGDHLKVFTSGASEADLEIQYTNLVSQSSGASELKISGNVSSHIASASGASEIKAGDLKTTSTVISASGASECFVNAKSSLTYTVSGSSTVRYAQKPKTVIIQNNSKTEKVVVFNDTLKTSEFNMYSDTTKIKVGSLNVEVIDSDTTKVTVGSHTLIVTDNGDVKWERNKAPKFNGHWGGVELGINGYVTSGFNTNWAPEYDYLNLKYEKSTAVNLNLYEQNIALNKGKNIGLITGLGLSWNNYRFSKSTYLSSDSSSLYGFYMIGNDGAPISVRKTKLTAMYLTVPLIFEMQTKQTKRTSRFYFGVGILASLRLSTHTKIYFNEPNKSYRLWDLKKGQIVDFVKYTTPNSNSRNIVKNHNSFYLQPFKFDATVRFGYGIINLFATYQLNTMFQKGRGPELYPWTAGITILGW
ncbi:MAG: DUF2807 domain-containing protein [Chlorobi bacterium]|nr:DUF2807 domain-containing protein [Chlorobiota bacterium]